MQQLRSSLKTSLIPVADFFKCIIWNKIWVPIVQFLFLLKYGGFPLSLIVVFQVTEKKHQLFSFCFHLCTHHKEWPLASFAAFTWDNLLGVFVFKDSKIRPFTSIDLRNVQYWIAKRRSVVFVANTKEWKIYVKMVMCAIFWSWEPHGSILG